MIYMGSKARLSKYLVPIIQSYIDSGGYDCYIEPMVGGGNMIEKISCKKRIGSDIDKYTIAVLKGLQEGKVPPREVSREFYLEVKNNKDKYDDFLVGYIGYELSFGAKWFGGYAKRNNSKHRGDIYSYNHCMKQRENLSGIEFKVCSFEDYTDLSNCVIYCDIPYREATTYKQKDFPYEKFYNWCDKMSKNNVVLVSEYAMPDSFVCIWEKETIITFDSARKSNDEKNKRVEKLFIHKNSIK